MGEFLALYNKNFIQWRRNRCSMICEFVVTFFFILLFIIIGTLSKDKSKPKTSYLDQATRIGVWTDTPGATFSEQHINNMARLEQSAFGKIVMKRCIRDDIGQAEGDRTGRVGLGPASNPIIQKLDIFFREVFKFTTVMFEKPDDVNEYVRKNDLAGKYSGLADDGFKMQLCMGITINSTLNNQ